MSDQSPSANSAKPPRDAATRRREALQRRRRDQAFRDKRAKALADPGRAQVPPVGLSVADYMVATGLSRATVYRYVADGRVKSVKLHGRLVIPVSELDRFRG